MKKQVKNLCLAAVVLAVLGGIYAIVSKQEPESTAVSIEPLASLTVTDLTYSNAQGQWHFIKDGDTWSNADDADCPLNSDAVQDLVNSLQELTAARRFDQPDQDADYGLDVPDYTVTLSDGNTEVTLTARTQDGIVKKTAHPESTSSDQRAMCLNPLFTLNQRREIFVVGCVTPEAIIVSFNPTEDELPYLLTWHRNAM